MSILNGLVGGGINEIPAGKSWVIVTIAPGKRGTNVSGIEVVFTKGTTVKRYTTDSGGRISQMLDSGTWTISVPNTPDRSELPIQTLVAESTQAHYVQFLIGLIDGGAQVHLSDNSDGVTVTFTGTTTVTGVTSNGGNVFLPIPTSDSGEITAPNYKTVQYTQVDAVIYVTLVYDPKFVGSLLLKKSVANTKDRVVYGDSCAGFAKSTPNGLSNDWKNSWPFKDCTYWCLNDDGSEDCQLNPNDLSKTVDGGSAPITTKNVMLKVPTTWVKVEPVGEDRRFWISEEAKDGFDPIAHLVDGEILPHIYLPVYMGYKDGSDKLRSISGVTPTGDVSTQDWNTYARNNGDDKWMMYSGADWMLLGIYYLFAYGDSDGQTALGRGFVDGNSSPATTGSTNQKGMAWGEITGKKSCKFLIEDPWGSMYVWLGFLLHGGGNVHMGQTRVWQTSKSKYPRVATGLGGRDGYPNMVGSQGTKAGLLSDDISGSETTGMCDEQYFKTSDGDYVARVGGFWSFGSGAGPFRFYAYGDALSYAASNRGARLSRK